MALNGRVLILSSTSYSSSKVLPVNVAMDLTKNDKDSIFTSGTCLSQRDRFDNVLDAKLMTSSFF